MAGADLVLIETMNDAYETKAAVLAAKESSSLPVFVTNAYDSQGKLMTGADPAAMVALLEGLRVDALGINCSLGPRQMMPVAEELLHLASVPVIVNPNAGIPRTENGKTVFDVSADEFADVMAEIATMGASVLGGCCGTTPEYIAKTADKCKSISYTAPEKKNDTLVSSYTHAVKIGVSPILIGERINPTGKSKLKAALRNNDLDYIISEGIAQEERGAHILDVNVGLPEIDETVMMTRVVGALQEITDLPLQIDTVNADALSAAMRRYNGKPLVNSVNGKMKAWMRCFLSLQNTAVR
jgi:5-methyltetrahydrofolate--homocysteine methyltransferase